MTAKPWALATLMIGATLTMSAEVKIEKTAWNGWPNCYRISNGEAELIITSDIGPRIMRYGFVGGQNFFWEQAGTQGKSGEPEWILRGGHRIWIGPEDVKYTYPPDNVPVHIEIRGSSLIATQPIERETGIEKQIEVRLAAAGTNVTVIHRLTNRGIMPLEFAPWALTMMAPGGVGITGFPPRGKHPDVLPPTNPLIMWAFTDLSDPRWKFTKKYMTLTQQPGNTNRQKLGHFNPKTWGAYIRNGEMFLKQYDANPLRTYPDFGSSYETFTNEDFLEIETCGPISKVPGGGTVEHIERWSLHKNSAIKEISDAELDRVILPHLR